MYFDGCKTIEELNDIRENLINSINKEYAEKSKEIKKLQTNVKHGNLIQKAKAYIDTNVVTTAYVISNKRGNRNEIIFNADGTVTI